MTPTAIRTVRTGRLLHITIDRPGRMNAEELRTYAAEYVADYKLPRDLIVRDIPRNPSGKILKHVLRSEIRDDSAQRT